jgi:hypothetical protein
MRSFSERLPAVTYCRFPARSRKGAPIDGADEPRRPAPVLHVGLAGGAGAGEERGVDPGQEAHQIVVDLGLEAAAPLHAGVGLARAARDLLGLHGR